MSARLERLIKREADLEAALRIVRQDRRAEELKQSRARGHFAVPLRGQQLLEAMQRSVA